MRRTCIAALASAGALLAGAPPASAVDEVGTKRLREAVTVRGILEHERVFQRIADHSGGTRAAGTPGYDASAAYVKRRLHAAGYEVSTQEFTFPFFRNLSDPEVSQVSPTPTDYETATFIFSGSGRVRGRLVPTNDVQVPAGPTPRLSTSGCEAADFAPAPAGPAIALVQRATCTFETQASNAQAAGYDAVIIFNEGQPGREELLMGTVRRPFTIPVVGLSYADGASLVGAARSGSVLVRVLARTEANLEAKTTNVIADSQGGDPGRVLVVGAHLDSVIEGPGINDNGSGSATILEIAEQISRLCIRPRQKLRFAFWGGGELGLAGSQHYVDQLGEDGIRSIFANLNFEMLGSPNHVRFVYDGDGSDSGVAGPPGSAQIEGVLTGYYADQGLMTDPAALDGLSDYEPFVAAGIPSGGLFGGADGLKTERQAQVYGGAAGAPYDPCHHGACDTLANLSARALFELGDGAAHATLTLARTRTGLSEDGSRGPRGAPQP